MLQSVACPTYTLPVGRHVILYSQTVFCFLAGAAGRQGGRHDTGKSGGAGTGRVAWWHVSEWHVREWRQRRQVVNATSMQALAGGAGRSHTQSSICRGEALTGGGDAARGQVGHMFELRASHCLHRACLPNQQP